MPEVSLIISFYDRIDYLKLVLTGLTSQTFKDFEIIVADDGSNQKVINEIESLSEQTPFKFTHLWHEDKGFRKNKILNRAIVSASSDYLIFIDGDCIPHSEFIKEHISNKNRGVILTGRRVNLSKKITELLTEEKVENKYLERKFLKLIFDGLFGESFDVEKGLYIKGKFLRNHFNKKNRGLLGCNFSVHKKDFLKINGFDERYELPSIGEDSDIQFRFELSGIKIKSLNNIAIQYHLFHKLQKRAKENLELFEEVKKSGKSFTPFGIHFEKES